MNLAGKIIIVTGSCGLLGRAFVHHIREAGATVIGGDIANTDTSGKERRLDITDESCVRGFIEAVIREYGRIDGCVHSAYPRTADWRLSFEQIPLESWKKNVEMQLGGAFLLSQFVLERMKEQRSGSFVHIGSIYGVTAPTFPVYEGTDIVTSPAAYSAIKGGLLHFVRYLAAYYAPHGVRVNAISPGGIEDNHPEKFVRQYCERVPMGRMGRPDDIAPAAAFLLSDEALYITGHNLVIDGGWTIQ